jgi:hypothetical protein
MQSFTVHEPPDPPSDRVDRAERLVFVKEGFVWSAALFTPLWLLVHRLWWALLGYVGVVAAIQIVGYVGGIPQGWLALMGSAVGILFGFEAASLRQWALEQRGWQSLGSVSGKTLEECERRFFEDWLPSQPLIAPPTGSAHLVRRPESRGGWAGFGRLKGA